YSEYVELETSASKTTIVGCAGKILLSAFPYAFLVATAEPFSYFGCSILDTSCLLLDNAGGLVSSPLIFLSSVPSSDNAFSSSSFDRAFPCHPSLFSKKEIPLPFIVLAITIVGFAVEPNAVLYAELISSKLCPSTIIVSQPKLLILS